MTYDLKDKVVLITGAATGIGSYVVRHLLEENVKHVAILDIEDVAGKALQDELNSKYGAEKVKFYKADVTNDDTVFSVFQSVIDQYGYIDIVINNAGILNDSYKAYKKQIEVNVTALVTITLKALELMRKDKGGKGGLVVNISSGAALCQFSASPIYNGTKSAVLQFTNCIGREDVYSRTGVRMVTVCFGNTSTALLTEQKIGSFDEALQSEMFKVIPMFPAQSADAAGKGVVETCKLAESGSTWYVANSKPPRDITDRVNIAYSVFNDILYN